MNKLPKKTNIKETKVAGAEPKKLKSMTKEAKKPMITTRKLKLSKYKKVSMKALNRITGKKRVGTPFYDKLMRKVGRYLPSLGKKKVGLFVRSRLASKSEE